MKVSFTVLALLAIAAAAPKASKPKFRSLYKNPIKTIESKPKPHIVGGQEATPGAYPYQAFLEMQDFTSSGWYCNGALITPLFVLTSAYCCDGALAAVIILGAHNPNREENTQFRASSGTLIKHQEYDSVKIINDIALVYLDVKVDYSPTVQPIRLPESRDENYDGVLATVSGWGVTGSHETTLSDVLRFLQVRIISNDECRNYFANLDDNILCTQGEENAGICHGDSGAPLVTYATLVGIASFGVDTCHIYPSAYTRISRFGDWIKTNINVN